MSKTQRYKYFIKHEKKMNDPALFYNSDIAFLTNPKNKNFKCKIGQRYSFKMNIHNFVN